MNCKNCHTDLIFYLDRELPEEKMEAVRKHLDGCVDCRSFLALMQSQLEIIDQEKQPEVSPYFFTRLSAKLDERTLETKQGIWSRVAQPAFFTLVLVLGIYGGLRIGTFTSTMPNNQPAVNQIQMMNDFQDEPIETFLLETL